MFSNLNDVVILGNRIINNKNNPIDDKRGRRKVEYNIDEIPIRENPNTEKTDTEL